MTIYSAISKNRFRSIALIVFFIIFFSFVFYIIGRAVGDSTSYFIIGFFISLISSIGSYFYSEKIVLFTTGAKPANKREHFNFYTVAENVALASGLPRPKLYVIEDQSANAFATGRDKKHAVICVTTGLLKKLTRTELEGVIAHEFSHIKNLDILLSSIVAVLVGTLVLAVDWLSRSWWFGRFGNGNRRQANPIVIVLFILTIVLAPLAATLIQLAISRKREFLADSTGALITRNPDALANALEKINSDPIQMRRASGATAHLFIINPFKDRKLKSKVTSLFSTHPPIEERVRTLRSL